MHRPVILETERLILRPHGLDDFGDIHALWSAPEVTRYTSGNRPATAEECWQRLLRYRGLWSLLGFGYFAITDKQSGEFLGEAGLADFHREITPSLDGFTEAGWALKPSAWGQGYALEALTAIFSWYDDTPKPRQLACIIDPANERSIQLAGKCGFNLKSQADYKGAACLIFER